MKPSVIAFTLSLGCLLALTSPAAASDLAAEIVASYLAPPASAPAAQAASVQSFPTSGFSAQSLPPSGISAQSSLSSQAALSTPSSSSMTPSLQATDQTRSKVRSALDIARSTQCRPSLCFALDGSSQLSAVEFRQQVDFIKLVSAIISFDENAAFSAAQYARRVRPIMRLSTNATRFLLRVDGTNRARSAPARANARRGVSWCARQLRRSAARNGARKMVVFGDGRSGLRGRASGRFLNGEGAELCAVQVGEAASGGETLNEAVGGGAHVLQVDAWYRVVDIVDELVRAVCDAPPGF